jgi:hypothetical protein
VKSKPKETIQPKTPEQIMEQLQADLKHWQRELRLDDVDIEIRWLNRDERHEKLGYFDDLSLAQLYSIGIRHPEHRTMAGLRHFNADYEVILVHELIHARNSRWYTTEIAEIIEEELANSLYEVSLDAIAEALVRARRGITR